MNLEDELQSVETLFEFGRGSETLREILEECDSNANKATRKGKKKRRPTFIVGEEPIDPNERGYGRGQILQRNIQRHMPSNMFENVTRELDEIGAGRWRNENLEELYQERFKNVDDDSDEEESDNIREPPVVVEEGVSDSNVLSPIKTPEQKEAPKKKNRKAKNALLNSLYKQHLRQPEIGNTAGKSSDSDANNSLTSYKPVTDHSADQIDYSLGNLTLGSESSSSEEYWTGNDSSYVTALSTGTVSSGSSTPDICRQSHRGTSKRLSRSSGLDDSFIGFSKGFQIKPNRTMKTIGKKSVENPVYEPKYINTDYEYKKEDFPPMKSGNAK